MEGHGWKYWLLLVLSGLTGLNSPARGQGHGNVLIPRALDSLGIHENLARARILQDLDYYVALSASQFIHQDHDKSNNQVVFQHTLKYRFSLTTDSSFQFSNTLFQDLGFQFFFDSITQAHPDETTISTRLSLNLWKKLKIAFSSDITSQLLNGFEYITDLQGKAVRVMSSSFMTPLAVTWSIGLSHSWPRFGDLSLGVSSARFTYLRDAGIFDRLNADELYGIPKGKNKRIDFGLSMRLLIDKDLFKNAHWNCDLLVFKDFISPADLSLKNNFCINLSKFIKTSLQTKILFEKKISKSVRIENHLTIGISFHL